MQIVIPGTQRPYVDGDSLDLSAPLVFTLDEVLDASECAAQIARCEPLGFAPAPITTAAGFVMRSDIRNNDRVIFDDLALAADLFGRVHGHLPEQLFGRRPIGVNERFRCYRYAPGQRFAPHYDGCFHRTDRERSELTLMVYLNDGFTGGDTAFLDFAATVAPRPGMALLFQHRLLHEGAVVEAGVKYVLRSDVMYTD
jgi:hypothetical protein